MDKRLALRISLNKTLNDLNIFPNIFLSELLNKKLIQGYICVNGTYSWHLWVEGPLDVMWHLAVKRDPEFEKCTVSYTEEKPEKFEKDDELIKLYETYLKSSKDYWKNQSKSIKDFKSRYCSKFFIFDNNNNAKKA